MIASHVGLDSLLSKAFPATTKAMLVAALAPRNHSSQTSARSSRTVIVPPIASATHGRGANAPTGQAWTFPDLCPRGNRCEPVADGTQARVGDPQRDTRAALPRAPRRLVLLGRDSSKQPGLEQELHDRAAGRRRAGARAGGRDGRHVQRRRSVARAVVE